MILHDRKSFRQILGRPTSWKYRGKISLRNIENGRPIKILNHIFIECFFKNDIIKYVLKSIYALYYRQLSFFIIMNTHRYNRIQYYKIIINLAFNTFNNGGFQI